MGRQNKLRRVLAWTAGVMLMLGVESRAFAFTLSYGGRLAEADGRPVAGPIDLKVNFYRTPTGGAELAVAAQLFPAMTLRDGLFELSLDLGPADFQTLFADEAAVWLEVVDLTGGETYPRQRLNMVPYAGRVPVAAKQFAFDGSGKLSLATPPEPGKFLFVSPDGTLAWATPAGGGDMVHGTYDVNANNIVDDAEKLGGQGGAFYRSADNHLDGATNKVYSAAEKAKLASVEAGAQAVTTATVTATGAVMDGDFAANGLMARTAAGVYATTPDHSTDWDSAYTLRSQWSGAVTGLNPTLGRTSLGLGTAATKASGLADGNLVELAGGGKLPAVDGSLLTALNPASLSAAVPVTKGGTGATTQAGAANAILPTQASQSGKYLTTDGAGASWAAVTVAVPHSLDAADGSPADAVFVDNAGNVGIGTTSPTTALHVSRDGEASLRLANTSGTSKNARVKFGTGPLEADNLYQVGTDYDGVNATNFFINRQGATAPALFVDSSSNVGIGTTAPVAFLDIRGTPPAGSTHFEIGQTAATSGSPSAKLTFAGQGVRHAGMMWTPAATAAGSKLQFTAGGWDDPAWMGVLATIQADGNVGIGTTVPGQKLSVAGTVESTSGGFKFPSGGVQADARNLNTPPNSYLWGTTYQATYDGFVSSWGTGGASCGLWGYTDANAAPTLNVANQSVGGGFYAQIFFPVKKGEYYKVNQGGCGTGVVLVWYMY